MPSRLSPIDASFLRLETPDAHMHVAWKGIFRRAPERPPVTVDAVRRLVACRVRLAPRFRQRLAHPPVGLAEPVWIDDERFEIAHHVTALGAPGAMLSRSEFDALADAALSEQLDRARALWRIHVAADVDEGSLGIVMQVHHAMVDGKSALELALLLLDLDPNSQPGEPDEWLPESSPSGARLAVDALVERGSEPLRLARGAARVALRPASSVRIADTLRRAALSASEDFLRPAPSSFVNARIGPRRTLVEHSAPIEELLDVKRRHDVTLNDVALTIVASAMRTLALARHVPPSPLKVMVPVSTRADSETSALGNRLSFVFVDLPVHLSRAVARLEAVRDATRAFKATGRAAGGATLLGAVGLLPGPLKGTATKLVASPRTYNFVASNIPGPRVPTYLLGAELVEAYPVVPLSEAHALSIGMFSYRDRLFFGGLADPVSLPEFKLLAPALNSARLELVNASRHTRPAAKAAAPATGAESVGQRNGGERRGERHRAAAPRRRARATPTRTTRHGG